MHKKNYLSVAIQPDFATEQLTEMPDHALFRLCKQYGAAALEARRKFSGLLPEVFRRRLYKKKGFSSIFEFAAKLAGMSEEQVRRVLNLEKKFQSLPALHTALIKGEVSIHKLARVASIATPENEQELAEKTKLLSQPALEIIVRDEKSVRSHTNLQQIVPDVNLLKHLSPELQKNLLERVKKGINITNLLTELLQKHDLELAQEKEQLAQEQEFPQKPASRYIPAKIRHHLQQQYGTKCAMPACSKTAQTIHHTARWSLSKNHNPNYLAPLCKPHHELAHTIDAKVQQKRHMVQRC